MAMAAEGLRFCLQALLVSDSLIETSGNPAVVGVLAHGIAEGQSLARWLAANGAANKLQPSLESFASECLRWLERKRPAV